MKSAEGRGRTIDEAVDAALVQLGESRRNVDVKVVRETPEEAFVEVTVLQAAGRKAAAPSEPARGVEASGDAETVRILVQQLLERMGVKAQVACRETDESIVVEVSGRDLGMLIGWRGETLRALQTMTNLLSSRHVAPERRVIVDVEQYRQRRENTVREIAYRAAKQVKVTGDPITLDAMQPFERRAIHLALQEDPEVSTGSVGEEPERRVVVSPAGREA